MTDTKFIDSVREASRKLTPDYPNINDDLLPSEHLWAITASYEGLKLANQDLHEFIGWLMQTLEINPLDVIKQWEDTKKAKQIIQ